MNQEYEARMLHPTWQQLRNQRLTIDNHRCAACNRSSEEIRLECHHRHYKTFWHEDVHRDLLTLCVQCHEAVTNVIRGIRYDKRGTPDVTEIQNPTQRNSMKEFDYGVEDTEVEVVGGYDHPSQRTARESFEQVLEIPEGSLVQTDENRRRF
jgi:hypothetical protein